MVIPSSPAGPGLAGPKSAGSADPAELRRTPQPDPQAKCVFINRYSGHQCKRFAVIGKLCKSHAKLVKAEALDPNTPTPEERPRQFGGHSPIDKKAKPQRLRAEAIADRRAQAKANRTASATARGAPKRDAATAIKAGTTSSISKQQKRVAARLDQTTRAAQQATRAAITNKDTRGAALTEYVLNDNARSALLRLGQPYDPDTHLDPKVILLETVSSAHRQMQIWEAMLQAVPEADFASIGITPVPGNPASSKGARIEAIQKFLQEATKTATRSSKLAVDAGIEERLVRIAEEQQALIADTVRAGLLAGLALLASRLRLDPTAEAAALDSALGAAANHLRILAAGGQEVIDAVDGENNLQQRRQQQRQHQRPRAVEVIEEGVNDA